MSLHSRIFSEEEFTFPQRVLATADSIMEESKKLPAAEGGALRLYALELKVRAMGEIDPDSLFAAPSKIDAMVAREDYTPARALMLLLKAQLLNQIYAQRRYRYDRVELPLEPLPSDISAWSGEQFRAQIAGTVQAAAEQAELAGEAPIEIFADALSLGKDNILLTPTVEIFTELKGAEILKEIRDKEGVASLLEKALKAAPEKSVAWFYVRYLQTEGPQEAETAFEEGEVVAQDETLPAAEKLYSDYKDERNARIILEMMCQNWRPVAPDGEEESKRQSLRREGWLRESLSRFPDWPGNESLMARLSLLTQARVTVNAPTIITAGVKARVDVSQMYSTQGGFDLYFWGDRAPDVRRIKDIRLAPVLKERIDGPGSVWPWREDTVSVLLDKTGYYILAPYGANCEAPGTYDLSVIQVVPWTTVTMSYMPQPFVGVMDGKTGAPVEGVTVYGEVSDSQRELGVTNAMGILRPKTTKEYRSLLLQKGRERMTINSNLRRNNYTPPTQDSYQAQIYTSRGLYHPGDSVDWAVVVARTPAGADGVLKSSVAAGYPVKVIFLDANYQEAGSMTGSTDAKGRLSGSFATHGAEALTGNYSIRVMSADGKSFLGAADVTVCDFKPATFEVKINGVERKKEGGVVVSGAARTYAGMPVADAEVSVNLKVLPFAPFRWFLWQAPSGARIGEFTTRTNGSGEFTLDISAEIFKGQGRDSWFTAEVNVTAAGGESREDTRMFTLGKPYALSVSEIPANIDMATGEGLSFEIAAFVPGSNKELEPQAVEWGLYFAGSPEKALACGKAMSGCEIKVPFGTDFGAGEYWIKVVTEDKSLAPEAQSNRFTLYDSKRGLIPPGEKMLFVPEGSWVLSSEGKGEVLVGVACEQLWVYVFTQEGAQAGDVTVRKLGRGFHKIPVDLGPRYGRAKRMILFGSLRGETYEEEIRFEMPPRPDVRLIAESIRETTLPGAPDNWKLRFESTDGKALAGGAIATMYNRALDAIQNFIWPGGWRPAIIGNMGALRFLYRGWDSNTVRSTDPGFRASFPEPPSFNYVNEYGYGGAVLYESATNGIRVRGSMRKAAMTDMAASAESAAVEEELDDAEAGAGAESNPLPADEIRESEVLQAFWMPQLTIGNDGIVELNFRMPQAIGAWALKTFAWTAGLESAGFSHYAVSSKPVMIQPTMPRFVRQGDLIRLTATVFNNSDFAMTPEVNWTLNLQDGRELLAKNDTLAAIPAGASAVCALEVHVPGDADAIDYTVKVSAEDFTDGEHGIIPILEDAALVVESKVFYLPAGAGEPYAISVPNEQETFSYTLQYCQNPVWNLVRALRGSEWEVGENASSPVLVSALFSHLAARKVITDNPGVGAVIRQWKENPTQQALESMLSRNEELKQLLLNATPWVSAAQSNTARMELLVQYLDIDKTEAEIAKLLEKLQKLQQPTGGFLWGTWSTQESLWCTETVLTTLGIAASMELVPGKWSHAVQEMTSKAVKRLDRMNALKDIKTNLMLTYARSLYATQPMSAEMAGIVERTLADVQAHPTHYDATGWAYAYLAAKFLHRPGGERLIEMIRQHEVMHPDTGISFPSVSDIRGYATIVCALKEAGVSGAEIEGLRQWVIVRTQAMDDLGACNPDYVIAAMLLTGPVWTDVPVENLVTFQGQPLPIDGDEAGSGYFSVRLPADSGAELSLSIKPNGVTPSYGSLTAVGKRPAEKVLELAGRDIAISKRILARRGQEWVETTDLRVGELVRVDLTLSLGRDMEYLTVTDARACVFEPVDQLPEQVNAGGLWAYRESRDASTNFFIDYARKGTYHLAYEMRVPQAGNVSSGIATAQNQMAPELTAHSAGTRLNIEGRPGVE